MDNSRDTALIPEVLQDTVRAQMKGKPALFGSRAVIATAGLRLDAKGGDTVDLPFDNEIGEMVKLAENAELPLRSSKAVRDQADVQRAGIAFSLSMWKRIAEQGDAYTYTRMCVRTRHGLLSNPCRGFADIAITRHNSLTDPIASDAQITLRQGQGRRGLRCTLYSNRTGFLEAFHYTLPNDFVTTLCTFTTILRRQPRISREG